MIILGIETSCDETAASIVQDGKKVLSSNVASSLEMHTKTGGIIPEEAAREQVKSIIPVIDKTLLESGIKHEEIEAIAVTVGPGLIGSLLVGVETAKTLATLWNKPIIPVNHLVAHLFVNFLDETPQFPAIGLVVSGGHTDFVYMKDIESLEYIGGTRDDACGEAFDKCARLIGLGYPGGPAIAEASKRFVVDSSNKLDLFPRPMTNSGNLEMSFSGLKTAVANRLKDEQSGKTEKLSQEELAAQIQAAIIDTISKKVEFALKNYKVKSLIVSGGVSANIGLRENLAKVAQSASESPKLYVPQAKLSTDNAVMVATCAFYKNKKLEVDKVSANPSLEIDSVI